jgi:hypothetical protein
MTTALEGGEGSASRPGRSLPTGKTRYPLYRRLGGPQGRSGQVRKISPPPGFDPRTFHPVTSRYTDYDTRPTIWTVATDILNKQVQPTRCGPPALGLGEVVTTPHRKNLPCCESFTNVSELALVNAVMNLRVPQNARNFLTS